MIEQSLPQVILITGTPGVGKTSVGISLQKRGFTILNMNDFVISNGLYFGFDLSRDSVIIDEIKLQELLYIELMNYRKNIFIEGHTSELVPNDLVESIFVLRCNPSILRERLQVSRDYSIKKIEENIQAEIMEECLLSVKRAFPSKPIYEIDSTNNSSEMIVAKILSYLQVLF